MTKQELLQDIKKRCNAAIEVSDEYITKASRDLRMVDKSYGEGMKFGFNTILAYLEAFGNE